jgi:hypothetical protein
MPKAFLLSLALAATVLAPAAAAQSDPAFPPGALAMETRLRAQVGPQTRSWIRQLATRQVQGNTVSEDAARKAIAADRFFAGLEESDVNSLVFLVMMQAARIANDDLREVQQGIERIEASKAALRATGENGGGAGSPPRLTRLQLASVRSPQALPTEEFGRRLAASRDDLDALSEMGELESLRLQMAMDRMSKTMQVLAGLLGKLGDSQRTIIPNLK